MLNSVVAISDQRVLEIGGAVVDKAAPNDAAAAVTRCVRMHHVRGEVLGRENIGELPMPVAGHVSCVHNSSVWVTGGYSSSGVGLKSSARLAVVNHESTAAVVRVDVFNAPRLCIFGASALWRTETRAVWLVWGGFTNTVSSLRVAYTNAALAYSLDDDACQLSVTQRGDVPSPRSGATLTCIAGDKVLLLGGRNRSEYYDDAYVGALTCDTSKGVVVDWRKATSMPGGRTGHAAVATPAHDVLVVGGWVDGEKPQPAANGVFYSPATDTWSRVPNLNCAANMNAVAVAGGVVLISPTAGARFVGWGSRDLDATTTDPTPTPETLRITCRPLNFGDGGTASFDASRKDLTIDSLRRGILSALRLPTCDTENFLIDYIAAGGTRLPLHLPDILAKLLATGVTVIEAVVTEEPPPRHFTTLFKDPIGKGTFGTVYKAINQTDNKSFALKRVKIDASARSTHESLMDEIRMMRQLRHENLVRYLGSQVSDSKMYIFMEYVPGETLEHLCRACSMTTRQIQMCIRQVLEALAFLHSYNVVHRDIKGANVLFDAQGVVKVSDFGTAKHLNPFSQSQSNRPAGTVVYMAPEIMRGDVCTTKADIWSLGCLIIEMAAGKHPFHERGFCDGIQVINAVGVERYTPRIPERLPPSGHHFVSQCLQFDPTARPDATALLGHEFVRTLAPEEPMAPLVTPTPGSAPAFSDPSDGLNTMTEFPTSASVKPAKLRRPKPK